MQYRLQKTAFFLVQIWEPFIVLNRVNSDRSSPAADRIAAQITGLVRAILAKRAITRAIGRDDVLSECGISSLDMVNLMLAVETEFDLKIPDRDMTPANFRTVARIEALVEKLRKAA
jgi:acyl carrier protein